MSTVIATISSTATDSKAGRVGYWSVELTLVNEQGKVDTRPAAQKVLEGGIAGMTHNQAALEGVRQVLLALKWEGVAVQVVTNNDYVIGVLARHWKPSRNQALIAEVKGLLAKHTVTFEKSA